MYIVSVLGRFPGLTPIFFYNFSLLALAKTFMTYCQYALCRVIPKVHSYLWHFIPKAIFCTELSIPSQPRSQKVRNRKPLDNKSC